MVAFFLKYREHYFCYTLYKHIDMTFTIFNQFVSFFVAAVIHSRLDGYIFVWIVAPMPIINDSNKVRIVNLPIDYHLQYLGFAGLL